MDHHNLYAGNTLLDGIDRKNSVQKEIAKDIILHKVHKTISNSADGAELKYMFIVINPY